jgi:hypothetical protein
LRRHDPPACQKRQGHQERKNNSSKQFFHQRSDSACYESDQVFAQYRGGSSLLPPDCDNNLCGLLLYASDESERGCRIGDGPARTWRPKHLSARKCGLETRLEVMVDEADIAFLLTIMISSQCRSRRLNHPTS